MAIYVEREGIEACITKIQNAIEQLQAAASEIDKTMGDLPTYWQGAAYDKAATTYIDEYQTLLTKTVPERSRMKSAKTCKHHIRSCRCCLKSGRSPAKPIPFRIRLLRHMFCSGCLPSSEEILTFLL